MSWWTHERVLPDDGDVWRVGDAMTHKTYLVSIHNGQPVAGQSDDVAAFVAAWLEVLPEARRAIVRPDTRLFECAQAHAEYLASRTPEEIAERADVPHATHYGRDWSTANERVRAVGYRLPGNYPEKGNHVESNGTDYADAKSALAGLLTSPGHKAHLMGEPGFQDRVVYGVGASGGDYVFLGCPPEQA